MITSVGLSEALDKFSVSAEVLPPTQAVSSKRQNEIIKIETHYEPCNLELNFQNFYVRFRQGLWPIPKESVSSSAAANRATAGSNDYSFDVPPRRCKIEFRTSN